MEVLQAFTVRSEQQNGVAHVAFYGELDISAAPILQDTLTQVEGDGIRMIMLDLRDMTFIDASGLHVLLEAKARSKSSGHRVILVGANSLAQRLFKLTGTEFLLNDEHTAGVLDQFTDGPVRREGQFAIADVKLGG